MLVAPLLVAPASSGAFEWQARPRFADGELRPAGLKLQHHRHRLLMRNVAASASTG
jgi:hypothetical protein